jgi:uncharacterized membrane protein YedE/YeeE
MIIIIGVAGWELGAMLAGTDPLDVLFFIVAGGVAVVVGGCAFIAAIEAWRRSSDNRRIRKHLRK